MKQASTHSRRQDNIWLLHKVKNFYYNSYTRDKDELVQYMQNDIFINETFQILFNTILNEIMFIDKESNEVYSYNCEFYCYYCIKKHKYTFYYIKGKNKYNISTYDINKKCFIKCNDSLYSNNIDYVLKKSKDKAKEERSNRKSKKQILKKTKQTIIDVFDSMDKETLETDIGTQLMLRKMSKIFENYLDETSAL